MNIKITKEKPGFSLIEHGKNVVMVQFPNCISKVTNKPFKWMPTYKELDAIKRALAEIERESWYSHVNEVVEVLKEK